MIQIVQTKYQVLLSFLEIEVFEPSTIGEYLEETNIMMGNESKEGSKEGYNTEKGSIRRDRTLIKLKSFVKSLCRYLDSKVFVPNFNSQNRHNCGNKVKFSSFRFF